MDLIKSAHEAPSKYFIKPIQEKETLIVPLKKLIPWTIKRERENRHQVKPYA